ncbi:hypothetical protein [Tissierella praeacuta]
MDELVGGRIESRREECYGGEDSLLFFFLLLVVIFCSCDGLFGGSGRRC